MAKTKTQGTHLYFIDGTASVLSVAVRSIQGISAQRDQIDTTTLEDSARTYESGLMTPGTANFEIQFDTANDTHKKLHDAFVAGTKLKWAIGFSDGTAVPTAAAGTFTLPTTRSYITFDGYISDFPFNFELNSVVTSTIALQISDFPQKSLKV